MERSRAMDYFEKELEKINVLNAFETKPAPNLKLILENIQTKELMKAALELNIKYESVDREYLENAISKEMQNAKRIENALLLTRDNEFDSFTELLDKEYIQDNIYARGNTGYLQDNFIVFSFYNEGKIYFLVPKEIKAVYSKINNPIFLKNFERHKQIYQYLNACLSLYGAFEKEKFIEIFNHYNNEKLKQKEFTVVLNAFLSRQQPFYEDDDYIASCYFDDENFEELEFLLKENDDTPFYMPSKGVFLKFEDDLYYEMTPQLQKLKDFILKNMKYGKVYANDEQAESDNQNVNDLIDDIELVCSLEEPFQDILNEFERHNILFDSPSQLNEITPLIIDVYNNVRTWPNRGNTHCEISMIRGEPLPERFPELLNIAIKNTIKPEKINRNDPCPCGSGKKYKKCCGQNQG
jgi:hypothetical protein